MKLPSIKEGKDISLSSYRGRVVLLNYWGSWCEPCKKELPQFDRLYRRYRKYGLTLVAVANDDEADAVKAFAKSRKLAAKVAYQGQASAESYGERPFPFSFVVDGQGVIRGAYDGYEKDCIGNLEQQIREQLTQLPRNRNK